MLGPLESNLYSEAVPPIADPAIKKIRDANKKKHLNNSTKKPFPVLLHLGRIMSYGKIKDCPEPPYDPKNSSIRKQFHQRKREKPGDGSDKLRKESIKGFRINRCKALHDTSLSCLPDIEK